MIRSDTRAHKKQTFIVINAQYKLIAAASCYVMKKTDVMMLKYLEGLRGRLIQRNNEGKK